MQVSVSFSNWNQLGFWDLDCFQVNVLDLHKVIEEVRTRLKEGSDFRVALIFRFEEK